MSLWSSRVFSITAAVIIGTAVTFICCAAASFLSYKVLETMNFIAILNMISLFAGAYSGSRIYGKYHRKKGFFGGAVCGLCMYISAAILNVFITGEMTSIKKLLLLTIAGAAGGVMGVNSKRPEKLRN